MTYEQHIDFQEWASKQQVTFFDGYTVFLKDWFHFRNKEDYRENVNYFKKTAIWLDSYIIQNCPYPYVIDNLIDAYNSFPEYIDTLKSMVLTELPANYKQNRKITITRTKSTKYPLHNSAYYRRKWFLECNTDLSYNPDTRVWGKDIYYYAPCSGVFIGKSIKSVVRHLRKQYLPKGITFNLIGSCFGEEYLITINQ